MMHYDKFRVRPQEQIVKRARWHAEYKRKTSIKRIEYDNKRYKENPNRLREGNLKRKYGISLDDYHKMFESQNGLCAGCNKPQVDFQRRLAVDHRHSDGKVRGLLCDRCNPILGYANENPYTLRKLAQYIEDEGVCYGPYSE